MAIRSAFSNIDRLRGKAYNKHLMSSRISSRIVLSTFLIGTVFSAVADDLDDALAAQKEKAKRHVYSESALIKNRNIEVPARPSDEKSALDWELKTLEQRLNKPILPPPEVMMRRTPVSVPAKQENWLTPAVLSDENDAGLSSETTRPDWVDLEIDRQKELQLQKQATDEEALINKRLREESLQRYTTETSPLNKYETSLRNTITPATLRQPLIDPLRSLRATETPAPSRSVSLFSPTMRSPSGVIFPSLNSSPTQPLGWKPNFTAPKSSSGFPSRLDSTPIPLSPLKRVRQSTPIHRKNPFSDDFMPKIKTSIWD